MNQPISLFDLPYLFKDKTDSKDSIKFLGSCLQNIDETNSQNFQDVWALYENDFMPCGFYVEFGATNGIDGSNTLLLAQKYGWSGILAEPNPIHRETLHANRGSYGETYIPAQITSKCVYTHSGDTVEFLATDEPDLSTIKGFGLDDEHKEKRKTGKEVTVETISLADLLKDFDAPKIIHYLSIDTEGSEYDILKAFFDDKTQDYEIYTITVEHNYNEEVRNKLLDLMTNNGYTRKFMEISRWDDFYVKDKR